MFNILILGIVSFLTDVSTEMVYPLVPLYLTIQLGATPQVVGFIEGVAESLSSILKVFSGYISDKINMRKPIAILGYTSSTLGKIFLYFSPSWGYVFLGRAIDRFGKGIRTAPRDALIADSSLSSERGKAYGFHRMMDTLGAMSGVILAYYFITSYKGNYKIIFLLSLIPAFLGVLFLFFVKEKIKKKNEIIKISLSFSKLDKRLKYFLLIVFIFALGNSSNQFLLLKAKNIGFSIEKVLLLYLTYNISYAIFSYPAGKLSDKIGRKTLLVSGYLFYAIVYLGFAIVSKPLYIFFLFIFYGMYSAFTEGIEKALISDIAPQNQRATLIGLHSTLVGIGLFPASFLAGILWNLFGSSAPFYFGGIMGFLASLFLWILI
jgi:MFS family permease